MIKVLQYNHSTDDYSVVGGIINNTFYNTKFDVVTTIPQREEAPLKAFFTKGYTPEGEVATELRVVYESDMVIINL